MTSKQVIEEIINRYKDSKEIYLRIRDNETKKDKPEIIFYKNGRKILGYTNSGLDSESTSMFSLNDKYKRVLDYKKVDTKNYVYDELKSNFEKLIDLGMNFTVNINKITYGSKYTTDTSKTQEEKDNLIKEIDDYIKTTFNNFLEKQNNKSDTLLLTKENYLQFMKFWYQSIQKTVKCAYTNKIKFTLSIKIDNELFLKDMEQIIDIFDKAVIKDTILNKMSNIITKNKNITTLQKLTDKTKTALKDELSEKNYQQKIMMQLKDIKRKEVISHKKDTPFQKDMYPFEMEYNLYLKEATTKTTNKGRVDSIFYTKDKIILCEIKYDENVIGGSNGIHKHLYDVNIELDKTSVTKLKEEFVERINYRNKKTKENIMINDPTFEYIFILGYSSEKKKENIITKIKNIYDLTIEDVYNIDNVDKKYKDKIKNNKNYNKNIPTFIKDIKCPIKFYLADNDLNNYKYIGTLETKDELQKI